MPHSAPLCEPLDWGTACKLHGDNKAPGLESKTSLSLASPETLD